MTTEYFIVAGCSFSAGTNEISSALHTPGTWSHYLLPDIQPKFFYNLAISGGGNTQICHNLIYLLESKPWITPENCLIGINFTELCRIDIMCSVDHPDATLRWPYTKDFNFSWINETRFTAVIPPFKGTLQKNIGFDQITLMNSLLITQCLSYLDKKGFNYFFMLMTNDLLNNSDMPRDFQTKSPTWFIENLNQHRHKNFVSFESIDGMHNYCKAKNLLDKDKLHPNQNGYKEIASKVKNFLSFQNI
jgi:hypothetical protein